MDITDCAKYLKRFTEFDFFVKQLEARVQFHPSLA